MADKKRAKAFTFKDVKNIDDLKARMVEGILESDYMRFLNNDEPKNALLTWLNTVEIVSVERTSETTGRAVYRFPVQRQYLNPGMTLHGGMSSAMFDAATTWVLDVIRKPGFWMMFGTSRSLNVTFLRPAVEGEVLLMDCEIVHAGKRLCLLKGVLKREKDGAVISTCEHQKYNVDADLAKA